MIRFVALAHKCSLFIWRYRDWRDDTWTGAVAAQQLITEDTKTQRKSLFGKNEIDIEAKSTVSLLVDEVVFNIDLRFFYLMLTGPGDSSILRFSNC